MLTWALCLAVPLWASLSPAVSTAAPHAERRILLGLVPHVDDVSMVAEGRFVVVDAKGKKRELPLKKRIRLEPREGGGLTLGTFALPPEAKLKPQEPQADVEIDGKRYRGNLILKLDAGGETVTVIEEVGIESYLLGVLPYEMDPGWPLEALKAQAVVARTFAYTQMGKYAKDGFDLTTDTRSQMYGGLGPENPVVRKAVEATRGEVLGYQGKILSVFYHACCGGHTESVARVWGGEAPPPLRGVKDRYCYASPLRTWTAYFSYPDLLAAVLKRKLTGDKLSRFEIGRTDGAGYVLTFVAKVGAETIRMKAAELRAALGGGLLRSVRIGRLKKLRKGVEFVGSGSGHGVGLCQWGARLQADKGRSYEKILAFYFPGSTLSLVDE
jgi:stage II sporulation protein D